MHTEKRFERITTKLKNELKYLRRSFFLKYIENYSSKIPDLQRITLHIVNNYLFINLSPYFLSFISTFIYLLLIIWNTKQR